jgi:hypothetical protein
MPSGASLAGRVVLAKERWMLDTSKYARDFPDDNPQPDSPAGGAVSGSGAATPSGALLAALHKLEREFSEILRAQSGQSDSSV